MPETMPETMPEPAEPTDLRGDPGGGGCTRQRHSNTASGNATASSSTATDATMTLATQADRQRTRTPTPWGAARLSTAASEAAAVAAEAASEAADAAAAAAAATTGSRGGSCLAQGVGCPGRCRGGRGESCRNGRGGARSRDDGTPYRRHHVMTGGASLHRRRRGRHAELSTRTRRHDDESGRRPDHRPSSALCVAQDSDAVTGLPYIDGDDPADDKAYKQAVAGQRFLADRQHWLTRLTTTHRL